MRRGVVGLQKASTAYNLYKIPYKKSHVRFAFLHVKITISHVNLISNLEDIHMQKESVTYKLDVFSRDLLFFFSM